MWRERFSVRTYTGASEEDINAAESMIGSIPDTIRALLCVTNGLSGESFRFLPVETETDVKRTWDSLQRANSEKTKFPFFQTDSSLLRRFVVVAQLEGLCVIAYDRANNTFWYEEDDELHQLESDLPGLINALLEEESEHGD